MTRQTASKLPVLKLVPILVVTTLGVGIPYLAAFIALVSSKLFHTPSPFGPTLPWLYVQHGIQLVIALLTIAFIKRRVPADYGLHWPRQKTYILPSLAWGALFGVIMAVVDYAPNLIAHSAPDPGYPVTASNITSWLVFEGVYVGPTEEIPFRALLVTYLAATMPGKIRFGRWDMNSAGVVVALIFALLHLASFSQRAWPIALGQQIYAFMLGVLYAYWLEKSRSVVAPIIGHNVSDGVEHAIMLTWVGLT